MWFCAVRVRRKRCGAVTLACLSLYLFAVLNGMDRHTGLFMVDGWRMCGNSIDDGVSSVRFADYSDVVEMCWGGF